MSEERTFDKTMTSEKHQDDPQNSNSERARPKPTIAELEWLLAAPDGVFVTALEANGEIRADLGPKFYEMFPNARPLSAVCAQAKPVAWQDTRNPSNLIDDETRQRWLDNGWHKDYTDRLTIPLYAEHASAIRDENFLAKHPDERKGCHE